MVIDDEAMVASMVRRSSGAPRSRMMGSLIPDRSIRWSTNDVSSSANQAVTMAAGRSVIQLRIRTAVGLDTSRKKSLPLSSTTTNAGKSTTSIRHTASMPSSG